ncbi:preprotein translocase subunit SecG, partial [Burkholderia multivorans]
AASTPAAPASAAAASTASAPGQDVPK